MCSDTTSLQWTMERIIIDIEALRRGGEDLSYNAMSRRRPDLLRAANHHFGSWKKAVTAAGIDYERAVRKMPKWTRDRIIETIRAAGRKGQDLSWSGVSRHPAYSGVAYAAIRSSGFGSWDEALRAAGFAPEAVRRYEAWTEEKVVRRIGERLRSGRGLNSKTMQEEDSRLFNAALKRFGAWDAALRAAGVDPNRVCKRRRWTKSRIRQEIQALWREGENLAAPHVRKHHAALYSAACKHFGAWTSARGACGIRRDYRKGRRRA